MSRSAIAGHLTPWTQPQDLPTIPRGAPPPLRRSAGARRPAEVYDPHRYAKFSGEQYVSVPVDAPGILALVAPDTRRNSLIVRNTSATANIFIAFGSGASSASIIRLTPNTMILFDTVVPQDDVWAIADAASATLTIAQSVIP